MAGTELNEALASLGAVDAQLDTLEAVLRTAEQVSESEAKARIDVIAPLLGEWFGRLSRHDSLRSAEIAVTTSRAGGSSKNSYTYLCDQRRRVADVVGPDALRWLPECASCGRALHALRR